MNTDNKTSPRSHAEVVVAALKSVREAKYVLEIARREAKSHTHLAIVGQLRSSALDCVADRLGDLLTPDQLLRFLAPFVDDSADDSADESR